MKRTLLLVAGAIGAGCFITLAAPASADFDNGTAQSRQFQQTLQSQSNKAISEFLNGNCASYPAGCPEKDVNPGVLHQFEAFQRSLQGQSKAFGDSIDPTKQVDKFVKSITDPSDPPKG